MKDEIKEILDYFEINVENNSIYMLKLDTNEAKLLLDYITNLQAIEQQYSALLSENAELENKITNLQQENERLKLELSGYREAILRNDELLGLQDYKSCCEKAIEYIKSGKTFDNEDARKVVNKIQNDLLNILQGEDNNE